jgi:hypothetical protein
MSRKFISPRTAKKRARKVNEGIRTHAERPSGPSVPETMRVVCDGHGCVASQSEPITKEPSPLERAYRPNVVVGSDVLAQRLAARVRRERATAEGGAQHVPEGPFAFRALEPE